MNTPEELQQFLTTHGLRGIDVSQAPADAKTPQARLLGTGRSVNARMMATKLRRALQQLDVPHRVNTQGNEVFVLVFLPDAAPAPVAESASILVKSLLG